MSSVGTKATTVLVPRTNISAITGAAITTERPIAFAGDSRFTSENRDVLESAERAESQLAEDVEIVE